MRSIPEAVNYDRNQPPEPEPARGIKTTDPEAKGLIRILRELEAQTAPAQRRILDYLVSRYGGVVMAPPPGV